MNTPSNTIKTPQSLAMLNSKKLEAAEFQAVSSIPASLSTDSLMLSEDRSLVSGSACHFLIEDDLIDFMYLGTDYKDDTADLYWQKEGQSICIISFDYINDGENRSVIKALEGAMDLEILIPLVEDVNPVIAQKIIKENTSRKTWKPSSPKIDWPTVTPKEMIISGASLAIGAAAMLVISAKILPGVERLSDGATRKEAITALVEACKTDSNQILKYADGEKVSLIPCPTVEAAGIEKAIYPLSR